MNGAQLHLALNHLPVVGVLFGFLVCFLGLVLKWPSVKRTGLGILAFAALCALPAYFTGEPAEDVVENRPGVTKALIHEHEESAEFAIVVCAIVGMIASFGLLGTLRQKQRWETFGVYGSLATSALAILILVRTAHLGGMIRHDELRPASDLSVPKISEQE